ncbi:MAG TPA: RNA methyltransferase, partial [Nitrosospira sp.]|nr:RNA methyltransferase [Nitrosospira sp.]
MKFITSRHNAFFKQLMEVGESAQERKAAGLTLLDGIHLIAAYRQAVGQPKRLIISETGWETSEIKCLLAEESAAGEEVVVLTDNLFQIASPVKTPTGIMALIPIPEPEEIPLRASQRNEPFSVLLEAMQNPGNLGSILRSAAAAGAGQVYLSVGCADVWSPGALRAAMGAHFLLRIYEQSDLANIAKTFNGKVVATSLKAKTSLYQTALTGPIAFVFGNEGAGLSDEVLAATNEQIIIPMPGGTESLNAASAAAVCFFERVRQMKA